MFRTFATAIVLALTISQSIGPAQAWPVTATLRFGDLDLSRPSDVHVVNSRNQQAPETICAPVPGTSRVSIFYNLFDLFDQCFRHYSAETSARIAAK
jgi:UrcA family protein